MSVTNKLNAWVNCLANNGIEHVYISPGSRNAPLIRAFVHHPNINCFSAIDERSAGFLALGASIALKKPVAIVCTSGTALLNYYPALTEAFYAGVPILAISADRPASLIDQWEGQCIRQNNVFVNHLGNSILFDVENDGLEALELATARTLNALNANKPVHVNVPLSEPLYNNFTTLEYIEINFEKPTVIDELCIPEQFMQDIQLSSKILVLNGHSVLAYTFMNGSWVILNDVVSNKWCSQSPVYWDAFFMGLDEKTKEELQPDLLITTGTSIISKPLRNWLRNCKSLKQWHIGKQNPVGNPFFKALQIWPINETEAFKSLEHLMIEGTFDYRNKWVNLDKKYKEQFDIFIKDSATFNEPKVLDIIYSKLKSGSSVHLANSSAVRYASWLGWSANSFALFSNRGASGIDGCNSTAIGFSHHNLNEVVLITGDVAFFYDANAFWGNGSIPKNLKVVLLNNKGGGIFNLINGPELFKESLAFQTTHHLRKAKSLCGDLGINYFSASNYDELYITQTDFFNCQGPALLEIETNQDDNVAFVMQLKHLLGPSI